MSKKMMNTRKGALSQIMKARELNQSEVASIAGVDVKTIRRIDNGLTVKDSTLQRIAMRLGIKVDDLLGADLPELTSQTNSTNENVTKFPWRNEDFIGLPGYISFVKASANDLRLYLEMYSEITWRPQLGIVSTKEAEFLRAFESSINVWKGRIQQPDLGSSLSDQLEELEIGQTIQEQLEELKALGICLYVAAYLKWTKENVEHPYESYVCVYDYQSEPRAIFVLSRQFSSSLRLGKHVCKLDEGDLPPADYTSISIPVRVDGQEVWDGKQKPISGNLGTYQGSDDDVPF